jgi:hypothetical protein
MVCKNVNFLQRKLLSFCVFLYHFKQKKFLTSYVIIGTQVLLIANCKCITRYRKTFKKKKKLFSQIRKHLFFARTVRYRTYLFSPV